MKVLIKENKLGDTRTATKTPTLTEFIDSNQMHCYDVENMTRAIAYKIIEQGRNHDITKRTEPYMTLFYRELCAKIEGKIDRFEDGEWYPMHCKAERHHLRQHCPDDVNLIDVIEMICDCVCAGMARSGTVYPIEIPSDILQKAVKNTVQMCIDSVETTNTIKEEAVDQTPHVLGSHSWREAADQTPHISWREAADISNSKELDALREKPNEQSV